MVHIGASFESNNVYSILSYHLTLAISMISFETLLKSVLLLPRKNQPIGKRDASSKEPKHGMVSKLLPTGTLFTPF